MRRREVLGASAAAGLWLAASPVWAADAPVAMTRHGAVRGYPDNGVSVFKGVRYEIGRAHV